MKNNNKKNLLLLITLVAIIIVLFVGIVYQFIIIKSLQGQIANLNAIFNVFFKKF